jgi:hypothetical protein
VDPVWHAKIAIHLGAPTVAENKTRKTNESVDDFLSGIENDRRRNDAHQLSKLMEHVTGEEPRMWGPSIVGFGDHHYVYESGREGDSFKVGFSPRKASLTLYMMPPSKTRSDHLQKLGKHKTGKGCLYINKLEDVDLEVLEDLIEDAFKAVDGGD